MISPPIYLKCEYLVNPICIDTKVPRFSWILTHNQRSQFQSAYQILVASEKDFLKSNNGNLWDSRKIDSEDHFNIIYKGELLESDKTYYWKVKWWDKNSKESKYSEIASFGTALFEESDWTAKWISRPEFLDKSSLRKLRYKGPRDPFGRTIKELHAIYLRKEFQISKPIKSAKVYICGIGYYELRINGDKIGNRILEPAQTDYHRIALYSTYDIKEVLKENNAIGVVLGNGRCLNLFKYDYPKLILQVHILYQDGAREQISTDETWKVSTGPIKENGIYYGEVYDAREEEIGWDKPDFDSADWINVAAVSGHNLASQMMEPIQISKVLKPIKINSPQPGIYIFDFAQNFTGVCKLKVRGPRGTRVQLKFSELIYEDGTLNLATIRDALATDIYVLKGEGEEIYIPHFTYHGFRYVELTGFPGVPTQETLTGLFFHSNVTRASEFNCSNQLINQIHTNIIWGQLSNLMSIPTDCPQRDERHGWMGDAQLTIEEAIFNFDMARFCIKYLRDIKLAQKDDGSLSDVVPPYWRIYPADPAWGTAYITFAWYLYYYYNDVEILKQQYNSIKKYVDFLTSIAKDNLILMGKYGDWCPPCSIVSRRTPIELTSSWYYYHDTLLLTKIAKILEKDEDVNYYETKLKAIKESFNNKFLKVVYDVQKLAPTDSTVSQTSNILPLYLNMVPENKSKTVLKTLIDSIKNEFDYHFNTGIVGTRYLFDVLTDNGYPEIIYKMLNQTSFPGYGYMIAEGATTLWERWEKLEGAGMNSHNHIMLGSVDPWFFKSLAGMNALEPSWKSIRIKPFIPEDMDYVSASLKTIRGTLHVSWEKFSEMFKLICQIPLGSTAELCFPKLLNATTLKEGEDIIWEQGKSGISNNFIEFLGEEEDYLLFNLGSGYYEFNLEL